VAVKPVTLAARAAAVLIALSSFPARADDLETYVREALQNSPNVRVLEHEKAAAQARVPQAGVPADPVLQLEASNIPLSTFDFGHTPMSGKEIRISQDFAFPGTLNALEGAAQAESEAKDARLREFRNRLRADVKASYYTLVLQDQTIETVEEHLDLARNLASAASASYSSGRGAQQAHLKARLSVTERRMDLIRLRNDRETEAIRLNALANRPLDSAVRVSAFHQHDADLPTADALSRLAMENRPGLQEIQAGQKQWLEMKRNAERRSWPGLNASLGYRQREGVPGDPVKGADFVSARIAVRIPLFTGRRDHMRAVEAGAMAESKAAGYEALQLEIDSRVRILHGILNRHQRELALFQEGLLPEAQHLFESSLAAYRSGRGDFPSTIGALDRLLHLRIEYYHHVTAHLKHLAELESVVGVPLDGEEVEENLR